MLDGHDGPYAEKRQRDERSVGSGTAGFVGSAVRGDHEQAPTSCREARKVDVAAGDDGDDCAVAAGGHGRRQRRGDGAGGGAFGDDVGALGDDTHRGGGVVERDDDRLVDRAAQERPHGLEHRAAAGAVDERRLPRVEGAGAPGRERGRERRRGFRLGGIDRGLGPLAP